tara:strand:- start:5676 stop:6593 length:918 start_codon:yes stop_codon:yes gene_type:complete
MRNIFSQTLFDAANADPRVYVVVADISPAGPMAEFTNKYPERFINVGVAEQSMIGICAGLALKGCRPFAYTIATFTLYRPFEMVRDDLCYQNLPVTVVGMGSGVIYSTLGGTHHTQEDVSICNALPNMQIIAPCDPSETKESTFWCALKNNNGPVYLKLGKAGEPDLTKDAVDPWQFGKLRYITKGSDTCILSYGVIMKQAMEVSDALAAKGQSVSLVSCHTLKPLDYEGIAKLLMDHKRVIVIEENAPSGGLVSMVKQIAWDNAAKCNLHAFGLKDEFIHNYGSHEDLLNSHGIGVSRILAAVG